jgi:hypothetical protein
MEGYQGERAGKASSGLVRRGAAEDRCDTNGGGGDDENDNDNGNNNDDGRNGTTWFAYTTKLSQYRRTDVQTKGTRPDGGTT